MQTEGDMLENILELYSFLRKRIHSFFLKRILTDDYF